MARFCFSLIFFMAVSSLALGVGVLRTVGPQPWHYDTIQDAIDASSSGDTVEVCSGTWYENIDFDGKNITVKSASNNYADTIIDGGMNGPVVTFSGGETRSAILRGFTITNGYGFYEEVGYKAYNKGGGIYGLYANPTIERCDICYNTLRAYMSGDPQIHISMGGAIYLANSNGPAIKNNKIHNNHTGCQYAGIAISCDGDCLIQGNEIYENGSVISNGPYHGYALNIVVYGSPGGQEISILENAIYNNDADETGYALDTYVVEAILDGAITGTGTKFICKNNIIADNAGLGGLGVLQFDEYYIINNTIYDDTPNGSSANLSLYGCQTGSNAVAYLYNNILWSDNYAGNYDPIRIRYYIACLIDYNCISNGSSNVSNETTGSGYVSYGGNNNTGDPALESPGTANYDYHLTSSSTSCIDEGTSAYVPVGDIDGDRRDANPDIGADEYKD